MDPFFLTVFGFVLLMTLILGGFVMLYPLSRRLAAWVDLEMESRRTRGLPGGETAELTATIRRLEAEIDRMAERQAFTESLLTRGSEIPSGPPRLSIESPDPKRPAE